MMSKIFLDTNILVYLFSEDDPEKRRKAIRAVAEGTILTGINNINETVNVLFRKFGHTVSEIETAVEHIVGKFHIAPLNVTTVLSAARIKDRYRYSYFYSLVIASALENDCDFLYTEDMQHGQTIDGVLKITDAFR